MNISYAFPQMIYIENEEVKLFIQADFGADKSNLTIGKWFNCKANQKVYSNEYIVKPLDTFSSVAKALNMSEQQVRAAANTKNLFIGQKIVF